MEGTHLNQETIGLSMDLHGEIKDDAKRSEDRSREEGRGVITLRLGSYRGLNSSPYGIPTGNQSETRPVYLVYP